MKQLTISNQKALFFFPGIVFLILFMPLQSIAQHDDIFSGHDNLDADITSRLNFKDAEYAMTTDEGSVDLILTKNTIVIQFSDRFLDDLDDEIRSDSDVEEASVLADVLTSMISSGVHSLLNRSLSIPLRDIQQVYYSDGKLFIIDYEGEEIFEELEINDVYIMEDFSRRDARRFVSAAEKRMI